MLQVSTWCRLGTSSVTNKGVLYNPQSSRTGASLTDAVSGHAQNTPLFWRWILTPMQRMHSTYSNLHRQSVIHKHQYESAIYIYIYIYILSSTELLFRCVTTLECSKMLQAGIETRLILRHWNSFPRAIVILCISEGIFDAFFLHMRYQLCWVLIYIYIYIYNTNSISQCEKTHSFPSPKPVAIPKLKTPAWPTIYYSWRMNNWNHVFPKGINAMWNANSHVQELNSCCLAHFQWH